MLLFLSAFIAAAQTNSPPASYIRSYLNDIPNEPLVSIAVTGATNVACFTIEEILPAPATALSISSGGVYLPAQNAIRWGPFFNTVATNVSYRLTGLPGSYSVNGGSWMDGHWYFSPGITMVTVLPTGGVSAPPSPPPQVAAPVFLIPTSIINDSFESPALGPNNSLYYIAMSALQQSQFAWTVGVGGGVGLFANSSALGYASVPDGTQGVSLQGAASISQAFIFDSAGAYTLNWMAASRSGQINPYVVKLDGVALPGTNSTANTAWQPVSVLLNVTNAGLHTLSFVALNPEGGDNSVGLDDIRIVPTNVVTFPVDVVISCATPAATIYYTLDGSLPTTSSLVYTGAFFLDTTSVVRARAFTNGWIPSASGVEYYGLPASPAAAQVTRSVDTNSPTTPVVTFSVTPGTNASCVAVMESLPAGVGAANVSAGGNYVASNNIVLWGPFFGTNAQTLSYQAVGQPGVYPVRASWSVDGVSGGDTNGTSLAITSTVTNPIPAAPPRVSTPVFTPASGGNVPVSVTITDATPGALIYYTLNGLLPTQSSTPYTGPVYLAAAGVVRAAAFTNGWMPSVSSAAYYGPPATPLNAQVARSVNTSSPSAPEVTFSVIPGATAKCVAVVESLPAGLGAINVSSGGSYIASNNVVEWGPFFGTNALTLSYTGAGLPGTYPVRATWSVDGAGGGETTGTNVVIAGSAGGIVPMPPQQAPTPMLTPAISSNLPVTVSISCSDPQAQIYYTTDGTLPTQASTHYTAALTFSTKTSLRARAFYAGYQPSLAALGEYVPAQTTNIVSLAQSVLGNGSFLPVITLTATPQGTVDCYAVVESLPFGLTPSDLSGDGTWDSVAGVIRWGPYLDNQPRTFSFGLSGESGVYSILGQVSFNGYTADSPASVQVNANYSGSAPLTNLAACATDYLTYNLNLDPAPGVTVTQAVGTVDWGDGTHSAITGPNMTFEKSYGIAGTYPVVIMANWNGYTTAMAVSGIATRTDLVQIVTSCMAPQIVTEPSNQIALAASTVQFTVSASSSVPMTYQWYFNTNAPVFSPSDFATLTLPNITPLSAGFYSVIITNAFGSVTSSVASLTVVVPLVGNIARNANGEMTLNATGLPNATFRIWATTNLASPADWEPVFTNTASTNGTWQFIDTNAGEFPIRFYRFSTP